MVYVKRDAHGALISVSLHPDDQHPEEADPSDPLVAAFAHGLLGDNALVDSDLRLVRVLEDVIDLLINRDVIRFTDLPPPAQAKLMERKSMRQTRGSLDLLGDDETV